MKKIVVLLFMFALASCANKEKERKEKITQLITAMYGDRLDNNAKAQPVMVMDLDSLTEKSLMAICIGKLEEDVKALEQLRTAMGYADSLIKESVATGNADSSARSVAAVAGTANDPSVMSNNKQLLANRQILDSLRNVYLRANDHDLYGWKVHAGVSLKNDGKPGVKFEDFFVSKDDKLSTLDVYWIRKTCKGFAF